jgi:hypothetical protein
MLRRGKELAMSDGIPSKRLKAAASRKRQWNKWVQSFLSAPTHPGLSNVFDATGTHAAGALGGLMALIYGKGPGDKVSGGLNVLENAAGFGEKVAAARSLASTSVLAARLGAASTLLSVGSVLWTALTSGADAIQEGVDRRADAGQMEGFRLGWAAGLASAAGLFNMQEQSAAAKLLDPAVSASGLPSQVRADQAYQDAIRVSFVDGYAEARRLPEPLALARLADLARFATEREMYLSPSRDPEVAVCNAIFRILPVYFSELQAGTWVESEELKDANEAASQEPTAGDSSIIPSSGWLDMAAQAAHAAVQENVPDTTPIESGQDFQSSDADAGMSSQSVGDDDAPDALELSSAAAASDRGAESEATASGAQENDAPDAPQGQGSSFGVGDNEAPDAPESSLAAAVSDTSAESEATTSGSQPEEAQDPLESSSPRSSDSDADRQTSSSQVGDDEAPDALESSSPESLERGTEGDISSSQVGDDEAPDALEVAVSADAKADAAAGAADTEMDYAAASSSTQPARAAMVSQ